MPFSWIFMERKPNDLFWTKTNKNMFGHPTGPSGPLLGVPEAWSDSPGPKCLSVGFSWNESRMTCFGLKQIKICLAIRPDPRDPSWGYPRPGRTPQVQNAFQLDFHG